MKTTPTRLVPSFPTGGSPAFAPGHLSWARLLAVLLLLGLAGFTERVAAQGVVPERFSFQGYMEDGNGQPLGPSTPVNYPVVFRIINAPTGGITNWAERQTVTFDKGNYSVIFGQGSANNQELHGNLSDVVIAATGGELYVQTTVTVNGSDFTILPRLRLLPTAFAFLAKKALTADQALSVNGSAIAQNSINQDRLSTTLIASLLTAPIPDSRLSANVVSGAIADSRLSANVALRSGGNTFAGNQSFSGNVGIGTATPAEKLQVGDVGTLGNSLLALKTSDSSRLGIRMRRGNESTGFDINEIQFPPGLMISRYANALETQAMFIERNTGRVGIGELAFAPTAQLDVAGTLAVRADAVFNTRVGIGTGANTPRAALEVRGRTSATYTSNSIHFGINASTSGSDITVNTPPRSWALSIFAEGFVSGQGFVAFSDARIKQDLQPSDAAKDLDTILKLKVTDYRLTDWVANGRQRKKGFIAQEVKSLIPEAVLTGSNFIPDIYAPAVAVTVHRAAGTMTVKMASAHGLHAGDKVRLMMDDAPQEVVVTKTGSATEFEVGQVSGEPREVFVFGREVSDFLTVDYDRIFTTGIAAIQELARKVKELESKQAQLTAVEQKASRADALEKANEDLQARLERQDKRLAALESLVQEKLQGAQQAGLRAGNTPERN